MPALPDTIEAPQIETFTNTHDALDTPWNVVIYNDPVNLMPYVTMIIMKVFGYSKEKASEMMLAVHEKGKCVVWTGERERAEMYVEKLQMAQLTAGMVEAS
jgi:ATP-dependent Clp protease adaptor protein ClpS